MDDERGLTTYIIVQLPIVQTWWDRVRRKPVRYGPPITLIQREYGTATIEQGKGNGQ